MARHAPDSFTPASEQGSSFFIGIWLPWVVFLVGLIFTLWLHHWSRHTDQSVLRDEFEFRSDEVVARVAQRLGSYQQVLQGGVGLFAASDSVTRDEFRNYVDQLALRELFPGIQGVGFSKLITPLGREQHIASVRAEGFPGYRITPEGERGLYSAIVYLEPLVDRNLRAFGYDMYSEPVRRAAMDMAWETGKMAISGKVRLVQENGVAEQAGFLMYVPVYANGLARVAPAERRKALSGWVYAPFRMHDFLNGILGGWFHDKGNAVDFELYDGTEVNAEKLMFNSAQSADPLPDGFDPLFAATKSMETGGRRWFFRFTSRPELENRMRSMRTESIFFVGVLLSCMMAWISYLLLNARQYAIRLASERSRRLAESESRFRSLSDAAPVMIWTSDESGGEFWCNHRWRELLPRAGVLSHAAVAAHVHADDYLLYHKNIEAGLRSHQTYSMEYRFRRGDGSYCWLLETGVPRFSDDGDLLVYVSCAVDITEQMEQAAQLARRGKELEALFLAAPDAVILVDRLGSICKVNTRFVSMFGYEAEKVLGKSVSLLLPDRLSSTHHHHVADYMTAPLTRSMAAGRDLFAKCADGRELPVDISLSPVVLDGQSYVIATVRDVTERASIKQALHKALSDAEAASRAKSSFVANMSHEIRTPLNGVVGMAELMLGTDLTSVQRQYLHMLKASADGLLVVVNDILDFSKLEAGQFRLEDMPFDLCNSLCQVTKSLSNLAREKGVNLACDIAPMVPSFVSGDAARLRQILWNLLGNALKFTAEGEVLLSVQQEASDVPDHVRLHFSVSDTGIGVPAAMKEAIFENFVQVDASITRQYGGTGLGLAICRHLVQMMQGQIWVEDAPLRGSIFHFTADFSAMTLPAVRASEELHGRHVLIVDDHPTNRRIYTDILRARGVRAESVSDGLEALVWLELAQMDPEKQCDLIVLDARMPKMNGFEFMQRISAHPEWGRIPVVLLSSGEVEDVGAGSVQSQLATHLIKPVCRDELLEAIAAALATEQAHSVQCQIDRPPSHMPTLRRVLVVDDNFVGRHLVSETLKKRGHAVFEASNGQEALDMAASHSFDLILMDMQMPVMDGLQATRLIRQREGQPGIPYSVPIVALTANAMTEDRLLCESAGMNGHLAKPIDPSALVRLVENAVIHATSTVGNGLDEPTDSAEGGGMMPHLLYQAGNDHGLAIRLIDACLEDMPQRLSAIRQAYDQNAMPALREAVHVLKGMLSIFDKGGLMDLLKAVENCADEQNVEAAQGFRTRLFAEVARFEANLAINRAKLSEQAGVFDGS